MKNFALLSLLLGLGLFVVGCSDNKPLKPATQPVAPVTETPMPPADAGAPADTTDTAPGGPADKDEMPADADGEKPAGDEADKPAGDEADKPAGDEAAPTPPSSDSNS